MTRVDAAAAAILVPINVVLLVGAYKLRSSRQDTFERWDGPLALARAAADDRALTALERLGVAVTSSGIASGLQPLVDPTNFKRAAADFLRELAARERLPRMLSWLLRAASSLSLSALVTALVALPFTAVLLTAKHGAVRNLTFGVAGFSGAMLGLSYLSVTLLEARLSALSGRATP